MDEFSRFLFSASTATRKARLLALAAAICIQAAPSLALEAAPGNDLIDLHAHLFMNKGLGILFNGDFDEPLQARNWRDKLSSQANPEALERSGLGVVVVSLYAVQPFVFSLRESIRDQIQQAKEFVATHPGWLIVKSPQEAIRARAAGFRVLIFSLEGTAGVIETEEDIQEFVEQEGVRIITFSHLIDDEFGGAAFLKGAGGFFMNPFVWTGTLFARTRADDGTRINPHGLTPKGAALARRLIRHRAWLDLTHTSDRTQQGLYPILEEARQPLLYTHAVLRKYHGAERGITEEQLRRVARSRGIVGVLPSQSYLEGTPVDGDQCIHVRAGKRCGGGLHFLARQYNEMAAIVGSSSTLIGSDTNGAVPHLPPSRCYHSGTEVDRGGFWNIGQTRALWQAMRAVGVELPEGETAVAAFLGAWLRAWQGAEDWARTWGE